MAKEGISKLPVMIPNEYALVIYQLLAEVNYKVGYASSQYNRSFMKKYIEDLFYLKESVHSTRVEGIQVTFTDMVEERGEKNPSWERIEVRK